jgi:uncharacterized membrane-anchored protein YitT (DUF2179 family)
MKQTMSILWNLLLISIGSTLCAVAIKGILIPKEFLAGGITGLALLFHYVFSSIPAGIIYFILNVPLFAIGWMFVGRRFFFYSLAGVVIFSAVMLIPFPVLPIKDMILSALAAGIITGVGSGVILKSLGSAGGLDILTVILFKKYSLRPGNVTLAFNSILLLLAALRIPLEMVLYTLIFLFVSTHFMNIVLIGLSQRKSIMVISPKWEEISRQIMDRLQRGVTVVRGQGGYTGKEMRILYSVITFTELSRFKEMIRKIDPEAFVVVTDTLEVMGKRIGNQPHW